MVPCSWKETFRIDCPTCGAQRSFIELIQGHFTESLLLFPALLPFLIVIVLTSLHLWKRSIVNPKWIVRFFALSAILMLGNWIINLSIAET